MRPDPDHPFLHRQLIAYIGNKRRLLPFISEAFGRIAEELGSGSARPLGLLDPFSGSGSVSRLGRLMGFSVEASDWEGYAALLARAYLENSPEDVSRSFAPRGGLEAVLASLNALHPARGAEASGGEGLLSRLYAPRETEAADWRTERLFYTRENALFLDRVRARIDGLYPEGSTGDDARARDLLLSLLLYEASVHANTSGVFKAFHKGFGGHGGDALGRIMGAAELESPALVTGAPCRGFRSEALAAVSGKAADIAYLDPPYNQHQYASNYHLLNAILENDEAAQPGLTLGATGRLAAKAGINRAWRERRSPWCVRELAPRSLEELVSAIDARAIVMSYSSGALIDPEAVEAILSARGRVELREQGYTAYRGGRQSASRLQLTSEFLFVLWTGRERGKGTDLKQILARGRLDAASRRLLSAGARNEAVEGIIALGGTAFAKVKWPFVLSWEPGDAPCLEAAAERLEGLVCADTAEEVSVCLESLAENPPGPDRTALERRLLLSLRKLAHPRNREAFEELCARARGSLGVKATKRLSALEEQARRRFASR